MDEGTAADVIDAVGVVGVENCHGPRKFAVFGKTFFGDCLRLEFTVTTTFWRKSIWLGLGRRGGVVEIDVYEVFFVATLQKVVGALCAY